ncbi:MAG: hypothetical protein HGB10_03720 [Coriobacteriia bacterium]|nr:hypothetical protein [Coriobacteriia bacterium]
MKKSIILVALAVVLVLAFATAASATSAKTWNYQADYYSWGSTSGSGLSAVASETLGQGGSAAESSGFANTNATAGGGVHSNYASTTAKCGICHSVHRAKANGVHLLNTADATCAGCHISGTSTVTNVVIAWGTPAAALAGPHGSTNGSCTSRACHATSPHGVGGSQYGLFNAKLLNAEVDNAIAPAIAAETATPGSSGVTAALLTGAGASTNFTGEADAIRVGYTCNQFECHGQTLLAVIRSGYSEVRGTQYPNWEGTDPVTDPYAAGFSVAKTGHLSVSAVGSTAYTAATSCTGCHDQADLTTRSDFTFPHAQRATAAGTGTQTYLWYNIASDSTGAGSAAMTNSNMKSFDGACLKCHRNGAGSGVGVSY